MLGLVIVLYCRDGPTGASWALITVVNSFNLSSGMMVRIRVWYVYYWTE